MKSCSKTFSVQKYQNNTLVPDWRWSGDPLYSPGGITPYPIFNNFGLPSCAGSPNGTLCSSFDGSGHPTSAPCTLSPPLPVVNTWLALESGGKPVMVEVPGQNGCGLFGWKGAQSRRFWQGVYGFSYGDGNNTYIGCDCGPNYSCSECNGQAHHLENLTAPDTKYLSATKTYSISGHWNGNSYPDFSYSKSESYLLDANTGVCEQTGYSSSFNEPYWYGTPGGSGPGGSGYTHLIPDGNGDWYPVPSDMIPMDEQASGFGNSLADFIEFFTPFTQFDSVIVLAEAMQTDGVTPLYTMTCDGHGNGTLYDYNSGLPVCTCSWNGTTGSLRVYVIYYVDGVAMSTLSWQVDGTITNTSVNWSVTMNNTDCSNGIINSTFTAEYSLALSAGNDWSGIYADMETLLANWPLDNDELYPWRTDTDYTVQPLVTRNEIDSGILSGCLGGQYANWVDDNSGSHSDQIFTYADGTLYDVTCGVSPLDPNRAHYSWSIANGGLAPGLHLDSDGHIRGTATLTNDDGGYFPLPYMATIVATNTVHPGPFFDGSVVGAPLVIGGNIAYGLDNWWDATQEVLAECDDGTSYLNLYGRWRTDESVGLPGACTQWTHQMDSKYALPGAAMAGSPHTSFDSGGGNLILANRPPLLQKFAVQKPPLPAQGFFGPAAMRRFDFDEANMFCIESGTLNENGTASLVLNDGSRESTGQGAGTPPTLAAGLYIVADESGDLNGVWNVPAQSGSWTINLTSKKWPLPDGYTRAPNETTLDFTGAFGPLKWPTAWCIGGRVPVMGAVQSGGNVILQIVARSLSGDARCLQTGDVVDLTAVPGLDANLTATKIDETHFSVPGTLSSGYTSGGWMTANGAPDWKFWDARPQGNFYIFEWYQQWRDYKERDAAIGQYTGCLGADVDCDCGGIEPGGTAIRPNQEAHGMGQQVYEFNVHYLNVRPLSPCGGSVVCISPNGETWPNGYTFPFPGASDTLPDTGMYIGRLWQAAPLLMQYNTATGGYAELWSQRPARPCNNVGEDDKNEPLPLDVGKWADDDAGTCADDAEDNAGHPIYYFPDLKMVEPVQAVPSGGAALPAGVVLNYLTLDQLNEATPPSGIVPVMPISGQEGISGRRIWFCHGRTGATRFSARELY